MEMGFKCPGVSQISKDPSLKGSQVFWDHLRWLFPSLGTTHISCPPTPSLTIKRPNSHPFPPISNTLRSYYPGGKSYTRSKAEKSTQHPDGLVQGAFLHSQASGVRKTPQEGSSQQPTVKPRESRAPNWWDQVTSPGTSSPAEGHSERHLQ